MTKPENARTQLAEQLNYLQRWLSHVEGLTLQKAAVAQRYQQYAPSKRKWGVAAFFLWMVGSVIALTAVATPILQAMDDAHAKAVHSFGVPQEDPTVIAILAIPVALVIASLAVILHNKVFLPRQETKTAAVNFDRGVRNASVAADERAVDEQLSQASKDYARYVGSSFPQAYLYPEAVAFFALMVHNHRAVTLQEAINLLETQLHRDRLENLAAANLAQARRASSLMAVGNIINAVGHAATVNAVRAEGAATRAAAARPRTVFIKRR